MNVAASDESDASANDDADDDGDEAADDDDADLEALERLEKEAGSKTREANFLVSGPASPRRRRPRPRTDCIICVSNQP